MFKKIIFIVLIISQWSLVRSQTISRQVISNGGGTLSGGGNQITFNIGETVIPSFGVGSILMTQGFEQPGEQITTGVVSLINCAGSSLTVPFTSVDILAGNIYTAQLSNNVGSFASPVNIGTLAGNGSSGSINITIPSNTPLGNGYRIRVVGSIPQTIGSANSNGTITVVNPIEYTYVKAGNPYQTLFPLTNGMIINQITDQVSILVNPVCASPTIESFDMKMQGPDFNWEVLQNIAPYALFDNTGLFVFGRNFFPGTYTLTVTGYDQDNRAGNITYGPVVTTFTIIGNLATISPPTIIGNEFCAGSNVNVSFSTTGTFNVGNQFQVQLSDALGSFDSPVIIGLANAAGTVSAAIPANTPQGQNYKVRVVSTNQVLAGNSTANPLTINRLTLNLVSPTNDLTGTSTQKAVNITASNKVISPANVTYQAGKAILLTPGFEAGAVFKAEIHVCNN